jgi:hypothetical protein
VRSFYDTFPREPEGSSSGVAAYWVVLCPEGGKLDRSFKPVPVEPWAPEPRRPRKPRRPTSIERVEKINSNLNWRIYPALSDERKPLLVGEAGTDEPLEFGHELGHVQDAEEPYEFEDPRYFEVGAANGIRSLMQPAISSADWSWRAPAARCRSCGCETWVASIADGIRMISNPRHRKGCSMPPNRLEIEASCVT